MVAPDEILDWLQLVRQIPENVTALKRAYSKHTGSEIAELERSTKALRQIGEYLDEAKDFHNMLHHLLEYHDGLRNAIETQYEQVDGDTVSDFPIKDIRHKWVRISGQLKQLSGFITACQHHTPDVAEIPSRSKNRLFDGSDEIKLTDIFGVYEQTISNLIYETEEKINSIKREKNADRIEKLSEEVEFNLTSIYFYSGDLYGFLQNQMASANADLFRISKHISQILVDFPKQV
jgi:hypothetical protein